MHIDIRRAAEDDIPFILDLCALGAKEGHFAERLLYPIYQIDMAIKIARMNTNNAYTGMYEGREINTSGYTDVLYVDGVQAGFSIIIRLPKWTTANLEYYMMGIHPHFQRRGLASHMTHHVINSIPEGQSMIARCYKASTIMDQLLRQNGFRLERTTPTGTRFLRYRKRKSVSTTRTTENM
jgi:hypothetical protein